MGGGRDAGANGRTVGHREMSALKISTHRCNVCTRPSTRSFRRARLVLPVRAGYEILVWLIKTTAVALLDESEKYEAMEACEFDGSCSQEKIVPPPASLAETLREYAQALWEYSQPLRDAGRATYDIYAVNVLDPIRSVWAETWGPWILDMVWETPPLYFRTVFPIFDMTYDRPEASALKVASKRLAILDNKLENDIIALRFLIARDLGGPFGRAYLGFENVCISQDQDNYRYIL